MPRKKLFEARMNKSSEKQAAKDSNDPALKMDVPITSIKAGTFEIRKQAVVNGVKK